MTNKKYFLALAVCALTINLSGVAANAETITKTTTTTIETVTPLYTNFAAEMNFEVSSFGGSLGPSLIYRLNADQNVGIRALLSATNVMTYGSIGGLYRHYLFSANRKARLFLEPGMDVKVVGPTAYLSLNAAVGLNYNIIEDVNLGGYAGLDFLPSYNTGSVAISPKTAITVSVLL